MLRSRVATAFAASLLAAPATLSGQAFEGVVTSTMNPTSPRPGTMVYQVKGTQVRADVSNLKGGPPGGMYMLLDAAVGKMMSVMPAQKVYMIIDMKAVEKQLAPDGKPVPAKLTRTGKTETVAGHKCEHCLVGAQQETDICAAKGLGVMVGGGLAGLPGHYRAYTDLAKDGFLPLKVTSLRGGKAEVVMEATRIEKKRLDASLFAVPAGYTEMDMGKMMQQRQKPSGK
ncbi:MAG TPA: DUF4412 domain-containing protein [Gemmatimonadales bacterium]|nr:DUF4412 domain-containing protein [Gemmatimonadales bacterium]